LVLAYLVQRHVRQPPGEHTQRRWRWCAHDARAGRSARGHRSGGTRSCGRRPQPRIVFRDSATGARVIVDQAMYVDGRPPARGKISATSWRRCAPVPQGFLWIGLKDPTDDEFALVNAELGLHPLAVEDAVMGNQRAKIDAYEGSLLAVLKTLRYVERTSDIETGEVMVFVGDRFVVTVRRGEANPLDHVRRRLECEPGPTAPRARWRCCTPSWTASSTTTRSSTATSPRTSPRSSTRSSGSTPTSTPARSIGSSVRCSSSAERPFPLAEATAALPVPQLRRQGREEGASLLP
jgi:hypothetical protein